MGGCSNYPPMRQSQIHYLTVALFVGIASLNSIACRPIPQRRGLLEEQLPGAKVSSRTLRIMLVEFLPNYAHRIELTADQILSQTDAPAIRRHALLWKINGISAGFGAASRPDPLAAFLDLWVLVRQTRFLFESSLDSPQFGPWQGEAIAACQVLESELKAIHDKLDVDDNLGATFVENTVLHQPLRDLYFQRAPLMTQNVERITEPNRELLDIVASLQQDIDEVQRVSALYAEFIPKQARWQAELFAMDADEIPVVQTSLSQLQLTTQAAQQISETAMSLETTLEQELQALPDLIDHQRVAVTEDLERMRVATLADLRQERKAIMDALHDEQMAVSQLVQNTADQTTRQADHIVQRGVSSSQVAGEQLLDRAAIYLAFLLGTAGLLLGLTLLWLKIQLGSSSRRRRAPQVDHDRFGASNSPGFAWPVTAMDAPQTTTNSRRAA
jgi:hypothetical protein